ncbi:RsmE family RNA methyltransferase [Engelhardtia mirabilis]|uniref:RsmE family RNA methyltransferase n=1 Tax=Engelhardtia mirabilis TaxID=2528011 RepID=UPI003AF37CA4
MGRFFVESATAGPAADGSVPRLEGQEVEHALRVLRAQPGDLLTGLDGRGHRWPLRVVRAERRDLVLEPAGEPEREPGPGEPGAPLPPIHVAVALPRSGRLEPMLDRLTQLGVARIEPLRCAWTGPGERWPRPERLTRVLREATKQSGRAWLPELAEPAEVERWQPPGGSACAVLHPTAEQPLLSWARGLTAAPGDPICLVIGPEGGFQTQELEALAASGAAPVRLGPHVLRIETAAEAAASVLIACLLAPG